MNNEERRQATTFANTFAEASVFKESYGGQGRRQETGNWKKATWDLQQVIEL